MARKMLLGLVLGLLVGGAAQGAHFWNAASGDWNVAGNWWDGAAATIPTAADDVYMQSAPGGSRSCNVPAGYDAFCNNMNGPAYGGGETFALNVEAGGSLTVGGNLQMANNATDAHGMITTAGDLTVNGILSVAYFGRALLQQNGGNVYVGGNIEAAWNDLGRCTMQLNGGVMSANSIGFLRGTGYNEDGVIVDLAGGTLVLRNGVANLADYWAGQWVAEGKIVGYGGTQDVDIVYDGNTITLSAVPEPATLGLLGLGALALRRRR